MKKTVVCGALVAVILALGSPVSAQPSRDPFTPAGPEAESIELASEPASYDRPFLDEFTEMTAAGRCSNTRLRGIDVALSWDVQRSQVQAHRVDISMFHDGFATGQYLTSGERPAAERQLRYEAAQPGMYYYWRLLTQIPDGWVVSGTGRFDTPICPIDEVRR